MQPVSLTPADREQLRCRGITEAAVREQLATFEHGIPFTTLHRPCRVGDGIIALQPGAVDRLTAVYAQAAAAGRATKFVPASGVASRMFEFLLTCLQQDGPLHASDLQAGAAQGDDTCQACLQFIHGLQRFAFYDALRQVMERHGLRPDQLIAQGRYKAFLDYLLTPQGLNYANLPKALLTFHRYPDHCRTPFEEHLVEAIAYVQDDRARARLHFTLTPAHYDAVAAHFAAIRAHYEQTGVRLTVTFSTQEPATDTIAVDPDNRLFRDDDGRLVFRPAGHGALLTNLQALAGDIVFIKNIDNVVPDHLKAETYRYKNALGGVLVEVQEQIFAFAGKLARQAASAAELDAMLAFVRHTLSCVPPPALMAANRQAKAAYLSHIFNRPLRVCGMVPNAGEPGGGPFWVQHADGSQSIQIVETSQVDMSAAAQRAAVQAATHFNPVDLVCGIRDAHGHPFDLARFSDPQTGFIAQKSHQGKALKALELPGLWNGAMAHWNTIFVETPLSTFNPVKNVLDLLRPQHQPAPGTAP